jgi:putative ABC transport system substrate-binding protein
MRSRRDFITLLGGAAAWPLTARAQQRERMRRIGVLVGSLAPGDPEWQARGNAFVQGLQERGWSDGRNLRVEYRWGLGDADQLRKYAAELVALAPDVILAAGAPAVAALQQSSRSVPIVFVNVLDPVGSGFVASLARPGGNATGFASIEFGLSAKWLELLKQVAPRVARVAVVRHPANPFEVAQFGAIQAVAPSLGVELTPIIIGRDPVDIERDITTFAGGRNGGLIVTGAGAQQIQRDAIIAAAAHHQLPAVYPFRGYVAEGGLISSLARPGGNATGINFLNQETTAKRLGLLHDLVPKGVRIAVLINPANAPTAETALRDIPEAARAIGLQIQFLNASSSREIEAAFATLVRDRADALFVAPDTFFVSRRVQFATLAAYHRIPAAYNAREVVEAGGLMSYGTDRVNMSRQVGAYTGQILKGAKPADLPVLQSTKFEFVINMQTARLLGLEVPNALQLLADEVIE